MSEDYPVRGHHRRSPSAGLLYIAPYGRRKARGRFVRSVKGSTLEGWYPGMASREFMLSPREFLRLTQGETQKAELYHPEYEGNGDYEGELQGYPRLMARMRLHQPLDALNLIIAPYQPVGGRADRRLYEVRGHEGRHRAAAAARMGISRVPVKVFFRSDVPREDIGRFRTMNTSLIVPQFDTSPSTRRPRGLR